MAVWYRNDPDNDVEIFRGTVWEMAQALDAANQRIAELERHLRLLLEASEEFLATPPEGVHLRTPWSQYTTAGDCLRLSKAWTVADKVVEKRADGK